MTFYTRIPAVAGLSPLPASHRLLLLSAAIASVLLNSSPALAQETATPASQVQLAQTDQTQDFAIAAQPLGSVLDRFSEQTGIAFAYTSSELEGIQSPGVSGRLAPRQALEQLLAGTGISYRFTGGDTVALSKADQSGAMTLPPVTVTAFGTIDTTTEGTGSYAATGASILKGAQSLREIPQSVSVMTRQRIEDQSLTSVQKVMEQAPGIYVNKFRGVYGGGNNSASYYSRGYEIRNYMVDGVASNSDDLNDQGNIGLEGSSAVYDRVEILRGAAGLLVGNGNPGGTVNLVRKRPTMDFQQIYTLRAGSWNNYSGEVDISGPLVNSGVLRGRVVAAYNSRDRFWDHTNSESPLLYGILEADLSSSTRVSLGVRHEKYSENAVKQNNFFDVPYFKPGRKDNYSPTWGYVDTQEKEVFLNLNHQFDERWELVLASSYWQREYEGILGTVFGERSNIHAKKAEDKTYRIDANLVGSFDALGQEHKITLGFNASKLDRSNRYRWSPNITSVNMSNNWDWPYDQSVRDFINMTFSSIPEQVDSKSHGIFGKLDLKLTDDLTAIVGGRTSWYDYEDVYNGTYDPIYSGHVSNEFTPYVALIYTLNPEWSAYISYADIFNPQWAYYTVDGSKIDHEEGKNYEIGIKGELYGGRLNTALSIYQTDRENTARLEAPPFNSSCPGHPTGSACYAATGKTRTQGFDAEINGELLSGWKIGASYTYTDSEIIKADRFEGYPSSSTPKHLLKIFSTYAFSDRLTIGGGMQAQSKETKINGDWPIEPSGGYAIYSAHAQYRVNKNIDAILNVNNIFDKEYWANGSSIYRSLHGEPRNFTLTLRARF